MPPVPLHGPLAGCSVLGADRLGTSESRNAHKTGAFSSHPDTHSIPGESVRPCAGGGFGRSGYTTTVTKTQVHMYLRFCGRSGGGTRGSFYHMAPTAQPLGSAVDETMRETGDFGDVPDGARSHARPHFHRAAASGPTSSGRAHSPSQNPIPTALSAGRPQSHMTESPLRARIGPSACALSRPSTPRAPLASPLSPRWALSFIEGNDHTHPSHSLTLPVPPGPSRTG